MNVIKQRQLSNGSKLTPKTDLVYNYKLDHGGDISTSTVFDIDGTIKINEITDTAQVDNYQYTSVGKGQFMTMRPSPTAGAQLKLWDKNTGAELQIQNLGLVNGTDGWVSSDVYTKKLFTFLGTPFKSRGDNDRYVIVVQALTTENQKYYPTLFNIDKWEWKNPRTTNGYEIYFDLIYDGIDKIYVCYNGERIQVINMFEWYDGTTTSLVELLDNTGERALASRIYGINSDGADYTRLVTRTTSNGVRVFDLTAQTFGGTLALGTTGTVAMCPAGEEINDFNQSQSYIISTESGTLLMKRSNTSMITLSSSTNEKVLKVIYFKHTPNVETEIWLSMVNVSNWNRFVRKYRIDWSAGYGSAGVVTNVLSGTQINAGETEVNNNEVSNTCNTYDIGKFYDYGLQKKWDSGLTKIR